MIARRLITRSAGVLAATALLFGGAAMTTSATAADYTMKIGLGTFKDVQHQWADWMKEAIEKRSNGRIDVKVFTRSQLGNITRMVEGVQLGTLESVVRTVGLDKNVIPVSIFPHSVAHYFAKQPIRRLSDFKGKKMRVNATPAERERMSRLGGTAVPMPLNEVVPALQRGMIDGTMSGTVVYVVFKFNQVAKTLTVTNDTLILSAGLVSKVWLNKLPADLQRIVIEEGNKLQARTTAFSDTSEMAMIEKWKKGGGELVTLPASDQKALLTMLKSVGEDVTKSSSSLNAFYRRVHETGKKY
jgi:TRAP-type C4-dicarboxylate transport system substrate-binding protein